MENKKINKKIYSYIILFLASILTLSTGIVLFGNFDKETIVAHADFLNENITESILPENIEICTFSNIYYLEDKDFNSFSVSYLKNNFNEEIDYLSTGVYLKLKNNGAIYSTDTYLSIYSNDFEIVENGDYVDITINSFYKHTYIRDLDILRFLNKDIAFNTFNISEITLIQTDNVNYNYVDTVSNDFFKGNTFEKAKISFSDYRDGEAVSRSIYLKYDLTEELQLANYRTYVNLDNFNNGIETDIDFTILASYFDNDFTAPVISGVTDLTLEYGHSLNLLEGITATDNDIQSSITLSVLVDGQELTNTSALAVGNHTLLYSATDDSGNTSQVAATLTVEDTTAPIIIGAVNVTSEYGYNYLGLDNLSVADLDSNVTVATNFATTSSLVPGIYDLTYTATDSSNNSSSETVVLTVEDNIAPTIKGFEQLKCMSYQVDNYFKKYFTFEDNYKMGYVRYYITGPDGYYKEWAYIPSKFDKGIWLIETRAFDTSGNYSSLRTTVEVVGLFSFNKGIDGTTIVEDWFDGAKEFVLDILSDAWNAIPILPELVDFVWKTVLPGIKAVGNFVVSAWDVVVTTPINFFESIIDNTVGLFTDVNGEFYGALIYLAIIGFIVVKFIL